MQTTIEHLGRILLAKKESISVAESVTGGYIQFLLSSFPKAQQFFQGGITAYNAGQKSLHLKVDPLEAARTNSVSIAIASKMAATVATLFLSEWSIGVTGFATPPDHAPSENPYCYYSIWYKKQELITVELMAEEHTGVAAQQYFASSILTKLLETTELVYHDSR